MRLLRFKDYRAFLHSQIEAHRALRGYRSRLAEAARISPAFLSQVLSGKAHLASDHAARLGAFWKLSGMEADYFVTLVECERAGTPELRKILSSRLKAMAREAEQVSQLAEDAERLAQQGRESYYAHWSYAAVHVLTGIPGLQSEARLAEALGLSAPRIGRVLEDLERLQLVERLTQSGKILWRRTATNLHLNQDSPLADAQHETWRGRVAELIKENQDTELPPLRYTAVHSLSRADATKIRDLVLQAIEASRQLVANSPDESAVLLCIDYCSLIPDLH